MFKFIRENPTIAFGLGLPLVFVIVFVLISGLPALLVDDPQYDVLYATEYYDYPDGVQINVINQKVKVIHQGAAQINRKPRIWRYNPKTGAVKEIGYVLPPSLTPSPGTPPAVAETVVKTTAVDVPDLQELTVDSSSIAPDGYEFSIGDRYSGNVFNELFYSSRYRNEAVLTKNGRQVRLPNANGRYYGYNTHFIGWVVSQ